MSKLVVRCLLGLMMLAAGLAGLAGWQMQRQGVAPGFWSRYTPARVTIDRLGVPTIAGTDWLAVMRAQGYVTASERLWQMDLLRRRAGGGLAEWFGEKAVRADEQAFQEDRRGAAQRAYAVLPADEKAICDAYAQGVNEFIAEHPWRWGIEYTLLMVEPAPWHCSDSLLAILQLSDLLTSNYEADAIETAWHQRLSPAWHALLFPQEHPWNRPLFGEAKRGWARVPSGEWLAMSPLTADEREAMWQTPSLYYSDHVPALGSNSWLVADGQTAFLANDPHLGQSVPGIWHAQKLKVSDDEWVVGVAAPGIPGITLGMNRYLAWAFTNTGEDVDDLIKETLSADGSEYLLEKSADGREIWAKVEVLQQKFKVRGQEQAREVTARFTRRGPLAKRRFLGDAWYARQWLPLKEGVLRIPSYAVLRSKNLAQAYAAIDGMRTPAQNVLIATRTGEYAYRVSGTGVERRVTGLIAQEPDVGEWTRLMPPEERRRQVFNSAHPLAVVTANERIWVDAFGHRWYGDDRKDRITKLLEEKSGHWTMGDMLRLQLDTTSRFRAELLHYLADKLPIADQQRHQALLSRWRAFNGDSQADPLAFAEAQQAEKSILNLLARRAAKRFFAASDEIVPLVSFLRRALLLNLMDAGGTSWESFGLSGAEVASAVVERLGDKNQEHKSHQTMNLWRGRHPLTILPVIGWVFALPADEQWGAADTPKAETPSFGPSVRLVWDLRRPWESVWSFPLGQSGHIASKHYRDFRSLWLKGHSEKVFASAEEFHF